MYLVPWLSLPSAYSQTSDFLVVQNTGRLVIYDAFQQSVSGINKVVIPPFAPIKILSRRDMLGDGLTPCTKVEVDGEIYYLLREEGGNLAGGGGLGTVRTFQGREFIGDTIQVIGANRLVLRNSSGVGSHLLAAGERLVRYFDFEGVTYVKRIAANPSYGWVAVAKHGAGVSWKIFRPGPQQSGLSQMVRGRVISRIAQINATFARVYAVLGKETGRALPPPRWSVDSSGNDLICVLRPATAVRFYPRTVDGLASELQAYVVGSGYRVSAVDNRVEIVRR